MNKNKDTMETANMNTNAPITNHDKRSRELARDTAFAQVATVLARDANENNFSDRRGFEYINAEGGKPIGFFIYDNNPFSDPAKRPALYAEVIAALKAKGCELAGEGSYPAAGEEDAGYTHAWVFFCPNAEEMFHQAFDIVRAVVGGGWWEVA